MGNIELVDNAIGANFALENLETLYVTPLRDKNCELSNPNQRSIKLKIKSDGIAGEVTAGPSSNRIVPA